MYRSFFKPATTLHCRFKTTAAPQILVDALAKSAEAQTNKAERTLTRFWKEVSIKETENGDWNILLDKRALKTPARSLLALPKHKKVLATLIAQEWDNQDKNLKPHTLPLTSLASRAIDSFSLESPTRADIIPSLSKFLHTDTVCFHEESPDSLVKRQEQHWIPLIDWTRSTFNVPIKIHTDLFGTKQVPETEATLRNVISQYDPFQLAAFERAVLTSKSYLIALGLVERYLSVDEAANCAHVEVQSQIDRWGQVEDTHDVDDQDVRTRLGSAAMLLISN